MSPASLQKFIDIANCVLEDRVQYSTVHIPNIFCDGHLQIINCMGIVRIHWVRCKEILWSPCIKRFQLPLIQHKFIRSKWYTFTNGTVTLQDFQFYLQVRHLCFYRCHRWSTVTCVLLVTCQSDGLVHMHGILVDMRSDLHPPKEDSTRYFTAHWQKWQHSTTQNDNRPSCRQHQFVPK